MKKHNELKAPRHGSFGAQADVLWATLPLALMAAYLYGPRVVAMLACSVATARLCDRLAARMGRRTFVSTEVSSVVNAVLFTLLLPASAGYWVVIFGTAFATLVGKYAFGGYGKYPFNLAALAYAVTAVSWPREVFLYPAPGAWLPLFGVDETALTAASSFTLKMGGLPRISVGNVLLGNYAGPMGATFCLVLLACFVYLLVKGRGTWHIPTVFLAACALFALAFPRVPIASRFQVMGYEVFSGALVYAAVFIVSDPSTAPRSNAARLVYGVMVGVLAMCYRYFGTYELGVCFAVLLANSCTPLLDRLAEKFADGGFGKLKPRPAPEKEVDGDEA